MQHGNPVGSGTLAKTGDHRVQKTGQPGQKKRPGEGKGDTLVLEIGFPDGLGMGDEKPRKHGQDPSGRREQYIAFSLEFVPINYCNDVNLWENIP
jgi:hypothetical protein